MKNLLYIFFIALFCVSCQKEYLEIKPDKSLLVPETFDDFQALLDNNSVMNKVPYLTVVSTDDIYSTDAGIISMSLHERNSFLWAKEIYEGGTVGDWNLPYSQVFYSNVVLEGLSKSKSLDLNRLNNLKGSALFHRAWAYFHLVTQFCVAYDPKTATNDLGIPLRNSADVNIKANRATLKESYTEIINNLNEAIALLPLNVTFKSRPTKAAALALLSRTFLVMGDYVNALKYADETLQLKNSLIDYNSTSYSSLRPFPQALPNGNDEILFNAEVLGVATLQTARTTIIDSNLLKSYHMDDFRKIVFFENRGNGVINFKGNYSGSNVVFGGLAINEIYLIRAECYARMGDKDKALFDLNTLMKKRWSNKAIYSPFSANSSEEALELVLKERRKELVYRNIRWFDLKRLNKEDKFAITITRNFKGESYTLPPNDKRYVFQIPDNELMNSGIQENDR